jgi:hypothetical protein
VIRWLCRSFVSREGNEENEGNEGLRRARMTTPLMQFPFFLNFNGE